jgi:hypothetical protein
MGSNYDQIDAMHNRSALDRIFDETFRQQNLRFHFVGL